MGLSSSKQLPLTQEEFNALPSHQQKEYEYVNYPDKKGYVKKSALLMFAKSTGKLAAGAAKKALEDPEVRRMIGVTMSAVGEMSDDVAAGLIQNKLQDPELGPNQRVFLESALKRVQGGAYGGYRALAEHYGGARSAQHGNSISGGTITSGQIVFGGNCGCGGFLGGDDTDELEYSAIRDYADSLNSATKQNLVEDVVKILVSMGFKVEGDTTEDKLKAIMKILPNPKNNKSFKADAEKHEKLCRMIANAINLRFAQQIIDEKADPVFICQAVAEIIYSLTSGMHLEFILVQNSLKKIIKNVTVLKDQMNRIYKPFAEAVMKMNPIARGKLINHKSIYEMLERELDRQMKMLNDLLNVVVSPAEVKLEKLVKKGDMKSMIMKVGEYKPGDSKFGQTIANLLNGLGTTAELASLIEDALKRVGLTLKEYADSEGFKILNEHVAKTILDKEMTPKELEEFMQNAQFLIKNISRANSIQEMQSRQNISGGNSYMGGDFNPKPTYDEDQFTKSNVDRRIEINKQVKDLIFRSFARLIDDQMYRIATSLEFFAEKIGTGIPLTPELDGFRNALAKLHPLIMYKQSYVVLIGYFNDALSKQRRETFISELRMIKHYAEAMASMSVYGQVLPHLKEIINSIDSMIKLIDEYSDKIEKKYGSGRRAVPKEHGVIFGGDDHDEEEVCKAIDVKGGEQSSHFKNSGFQDEYEGGNDDMDSTNAIYGGDIADLPRPSVMRKVPRSLAKVTQKFDYYYKVAQIKENMKHAGKELDAYAEKYGEIRAEAVAKKINLIKDWKEDKIAKLKLAEPALETKFTGDNDALKNVKKICNNTRLFIDKYSLALSNFWRTVEAVDEYMRVFTNDMVKNINDIQEIKNMLDETEVVYDWYTKETGSYICDLFEKFPCYISGDSSLNPSAGANKRLFSKYATKGTEHYYATIGTKYDNKTPAINRDTLIPYLPGNPYLVLDADDGAVGFSGVEQIDKIMRNFVVLKNIMSIFINIGDKFGKNTVHKQIFMSPVQIYRNLVDFIKYCSFGIGLRMGSLVMDDTTSTVTPNLVMIPANENIYNMEASNKWPTNVVFVSGFNPDDALTHFRAEFGIYMRSAYSQLQGGSLLEEADDMFVLMIKSMCAKILTVVGMYDLMSRPTEKQYMSPVRFIIGGNYENPEIIEQAVELYVRLPLMAEFYRKLFDFYGEEQELDANQNFLNMQHRTNRAEKISMMPEAEGNFSALVKLIFRKARGLNVKNYSDMEIKEVIKAINDIWSKLHSAGGSDPVGYIIREFVKEINMRYGLIARDEQQKYEGIKGERFRYQELRNLESQYRDVDVPILPNEESVIGFDQRQVMAPSRKYERANNMELEEFKEKQSPYFIVEEHRMLLNRFRCLIDSYFRKNVDVADQNRINDLNAGPYDFGQAKDDKISLRPSIKSAKMQLKEEKDPNSRYRIISKIVKGDDIVTHADSMKYVMFHETIITGLTALSYIHTLLAKYQLLVLTTDLDFIKKKAVGNFSLTNVNNWLQQEYQPTGDQTIIAPEHYYDTTSNVFNQVVKAANILEHIINFVSLFNNNTNGLVEVQIGDDSINVNFTRLKEVVNKLFEYIKYFWDAFKLAFTPEEYTTLHNQYINKETTGSLYWLHEQIVEKLFIGRDKVTANTTLNVTELTPYVNLDKLNIILSKTFKLLLETNGFNYGQTFAGLIFYNNQNNNNGLFMLGNVGADSPASGIEYLSPMGKLFMLDTGAKQIVYPKYSNRFTQLYTFDEDMENNNTSLLFSFNQLLAKYLNMCFDKASDKIYINTISNLVNGPLNRAIMDVEKQTYPDYIPGETALKIISATGGDLDKNALLIYTHSQTLGNAATTQNKLVALANIVETINAGRAIVPPPFALFGDLVANINNPKWPKFFVDAVNLENASPNSIPAAQFADYIDKGYKLYFKNASYFITKNEMAIQKDIPVTVNVADPTLNTATSQFVARTDPQPDKILYTTLALIMRNILHSKNQANQMPIYTLDNIAEVSPYLKETFRANMPFFKQQFKAIISKCNMLKNVMNMGKMNLNRVIAAVGLYNNVNDLLSNEGGANSDDKNRNLVHFSGILDSIIRASNSVITCIDNVLREIPDDPKYFELHAGSIQEYKALNGKEPFMPISSIIGATSILADGLSGFTIGTTKFKLFYGTRGLYGRQNVKITQENTPGPFQILDMYNMMVSEKESIEKSKLNGFLDNFVDIFKLINDMMISSKNIYNEAATGLFTNYPNGRVSRISVMGSPNVVSPSNRLIQSVIKSRSPDTYKLYQYAKNYEVIVSLTESSFKEMSMKQISRHVAGDRAGSNESLDIINILDLNIIPINIHALMRDIPLANLYNYAYTFDRLIVELYYGIQDNFGNVLIWHLCEDENGKEKYPNGSLDRFIVAETTNPFDNANTAQFGHGSSGVDRPKTVIKSPKELLVAMLFKPYREIVTPLEYKFIKRMFIGDDTNLPLGRPKFLSEQLYNKSLFGEMRDTSTPYVYKPRGDDLPDDLAYPNENEFNKNYGEVRPAAHVFNNVQLDANTVKALKFVGKLRYNTIFVRNIQFLVNIYRSLRLKLHNDLTYNKDIVVKSHALTRADNTEFKGWQQQKYSAEFDNMFSGF